LISLGIVGVGLVAGSLAWGYQEGAPERERKAAVAERAEAAEAAERAELLRASLVGEVTYEVDGSATSASVTMEMPSGTSQVSVDLPLTNQDGDVGVTNKFSRGSFVYISAQNKESYGSVTCRIKVDGAVISENTSSGAYAIATCKGTS